MIHRNSLVIIFLAIAVISFSSWGFAAAPSDEIDQEAAPKPTNSDAPVPEEKPAQMEEIIVQPSPDTIQPAMIPVYNPPLRGAPRGRIGGGSRGIGDDMYTLFVLAPDHVGRTSHEQPTLFWYLSKTSEYSIELTLIESTALSPLLETRIGPPVHAGVHALQLKDYDVHLERGVEYQWFVSIVPDPKHRSKDVLAGGAIERIDIPVEVNDKLSQGGEWESVLVYAESGLWYDAISALSSLGEKLSDDAVPNQARSSLLDQVGLPGSEITQAE